MASNLRTQQKWSRDEMVCFVGGVGIIKSYRPESNKWTYVVEMEMGPKPDCGRLGSETTIILYEHDILGVAC